MGSRRSPSWSSPLGAECTRSRTRRIRRPTPPWRSSKSSHHATVTATPSRQASTLVMRRSPCAPRATAGPRSAGPSTAAHTRARAGRSPSALTSSARWQQLAIPPRPASSSSPEQSAPLAGFHRISENPRPYPSDTPDRPYLDATHFRPRKVRRDLGGFLEAVGFDDVEAAEHLLRFGERAIRHGATPAADAHRLRRRRVLEHLALDQLP